MQTFILALLLTLSCAPLCHAQSKPPTDTSSKHQQKDENEHRKPPQHAFDLCKGKKEGNPVQIITPRGKTIEAKCMSSNDGLFARPEHPPREDKEERKPQQP